MENSAARHTYEFFATCPRNTEELLLSELRALGAAGAKATRAGAAFAGPLELGYRACLWSRVASRILLRLTSFVAESSQDIYEGARGVDWLDHLSVSGSLAVEVTSAVHRGPLAATNTHFLAQRVKDAVVDFFRAKTGTRPTVDRERPDVRINVHLAAGRAAGAEMAGAEIILSLDLSGISLHQRGYRTEGGEAPLKENLAAAILMRAGWPEIAARAGALVDPMCGSGTFVIEGALLAADIAPGLLRDYFGFLGWKGHEAELWKRLREEAEERRQEGLHRLPPLLGYDADPLAIRRARANARRAGLEAQVNFAVRDLAALGIPATPSISSLPPGLVVTNPPYGERLGTDKELVELYEMLGKTLKTTFPGWEAAVLAADLGLSDHLQLRAHRVNVFYNGSLPCRLLVFHLAEKPGEDASGWGVSARAVSARGAEMFANRLQKNFRHRKRWAAREQVHCFRVYDADLPEYNVAVDLYEDWAHVQEYAPPPTVDPVKARRRLKEVLDVIPEVLGVPPEQVVLKVRQRQRGSAQYQKLSDQSRLIEVREGDLRFLVNLTDYLDTGLFLDHRPTRRLIRELARGKRFLNLFGYTGSATVYAAAGCATATTTVDLSARYLEWARRNLELNGLLGPQHEFVRADCRQWLAAQAEAARPVPEDSRRSRSTRARTSRDSSPYDLIFLDAPTFSNSKRAGRDLDLQRDHPELIRAAARLLAPGGILLFSTNSRRFRLDSSLADEFAVTDMTRQTIPPDFARNPRIHRCFRITLRQ